MTLFEFLRANPRPTLVYVAMQQQCEIHAEVLISQDFKAAPFHAGLKPEHKQQVQENFMSGAVQIVRALSLAVVVQPYQLLTKVPRSVPPLHSGWALIKLTSEM